MSRLFPTGTFTSGPWKADVHRVDGPGGPDLNPRVKPHDAALMARFLEALLPMELPRACSAVLDGGIWEIPATPQLFRGLGFDRDAWSLQVGSECRIGFGGVAPTEVDRTLLVRALELYARAVLHLFAGLEVAEVGGPQQGKAPPWVGHLRLFHVRLLAEVGNDRFTSVQATEDAG